MSFDAVAERNFILQLIQELKQRHSSEAVREFAEELSGAIRRHASGIARPKPINSTPMTMADLVTPKQLVAIRSIANSQGVNAEAECFEHFKVRPEELSKGAASWLIDELRGMQSQRGRHIA
jgi:hypothetical protein